MRNRSIVILLLIIATGWVGGCASTTASQPSPAINHEAALQSPPIELAAAPAPRPEGSLYSDSYRANLYEDVRAHNIGDIITINVVETAKASKEAKTQTGRSNDVSAGITGLLGFETEIPTNSASVKPSALVGAKYESTFNGTGKTTRNETMSAQISARIIQVLPSGNMVIRGSREITVNHEKQYIVIQGVVRPEDISPNNTILSTYIADARIDYSGRGDISDNQRPGWLARFLNNIWPF